MTIEKKNVRKTETEELLAEDAAPEEAKPAPKKRTRKPRTTRATAAAEVAAETGGTVTAAPPPAMPVEPPVEPAPSATPEPAAPAPSAADAASAAPDTPAEAAPVAAPPAAASPDVPAEPAAPTAPVAPAAAPAVSAASPVPAATAAAKERIFALDVGTRSVIGIVAAVEADGSMTVLDTTRREHKTRAMLDGQIHDVPQVAAVIREVKAALEASAGSLDKVAVAAAGRALYPETCDAEMEFDCTITEEQEHRLDFAGVQAAQAKLASSTDIGDPSRYYCVGYSTIKYILDGNRLKSLVGQRGHLAQATVIATFLPRQVIDSMDSALQASGLAMQAITLEPIAAINVLIPPTMRHLNLVLVDIGAGTSDVAITKNGSVIAYGMVPMAGDEITEAISQKFLLDFNVAERIKREATGGNSVSFDDILGTHYDKAADQVIEPIMPNIEKLADAIAKQIIELNGEEPQAVLLVGGGSLTPHLAEVVSNILKLPAGRVAVRHPEIVDGVNGLPDVLRLPDAVTPLGILKIASLNTLHFLTVYVNDQEYRLFNFRDLTISDALLSAGIHLKKFNGKPGLGTSVTIDGQTRFFPGTMGTLAKLTLEGESATIDMPIHDGSHIEIEPGESGANPDIRISDLVEDPPETTIFVNGFEKKIPAQFLVNDKPAEPDQLLQDGDTVTSRDTRSVGEALAAAGYPPTGRKIKYYLNGSESQYAAKPDILLNDSPSTLSADVQEGDRIEYQLNEEPKLAQVLGIEDRDTSITILYNGVEEKIPSAVVSIEMNGRPATANTLLAEGAKIHFDRSERRTTIVSTALAAVGFEPPPAASRVSFDILLNGSSAKFTDPIKNGDSLEVKITPIETPPAPTTSEAPPPLKEGLLGDYLAKLQQEKEPTPAPEPETPAAPEPAVTTPPASSDTPFIATPAKPRTRFGWDRFRS